jgi:hypothetical protein
MVGVLPNWIEEVDEERWKRIGRNKNFKVLFFLV